MQGVSSNTSRGMARYRQIFDGIERRHADSLSAVEAQEALADADAECCQLPVACIITSRNLVSADIDDMARDRPLPLLFLQVLQRSRLPNQELEAIWQLSDVDQAW